MPMPIRKISDEMIESQKLESLVDFDSILPILQMYPLIILQEAKPGKREKEAIKDVWLKSTDIGDDTMKVNSDVSVQNIAYLKSKGYVNGEGDTYQLTSSGKKLLKDFILNDEENSFCKQASKQLVSKNSYDFGEEVLVKVKNPEKFGARYITISKQSFAKQKLQSKEILSYNVQTKNKNGELKKLSEYSDEELIQVLHLAKKIIRNSSKIAFASSQSIPVNRIKAFADIIMKELNEKRAQRQPRTMQFFIDKYNEKNPESPMELNVINEDNMIMRIEGKKVAQGSRIWMGEWLQKKLGEAGIPGLWSDEDEASEI